MTISLKSWTKYKLINFLMVFYITSVHVSKYFFEDYGNLKRVKILFIAWLKKNQEKRNLTFDYYMVDLLNDRYVVKFALKIFCFILY